MILGGAVYSSPSSPQARPCRLFSAWGVNHQQVYKMASSSRDRNAWKEMQKRSFTNWFNDRLRGNLKAAKVQVQDLQTDLKDGLLIITLLEQLAKPRKVGRYCRNPVNKLQCISNLDVGLGFITESENIKLVNIGEYCHLTR